MWAARVVGVGLVVGGGSLLSEAAHIGKGAVGRQFNNGGGFGNTHQGAGFGGNNNNWGFNNNNGGGYAMNNNNGGGGYAMNNNNIQQQQQQSNNNNGLQSSTDYNALLQQYNPSQQGYYDPFTLDYAQDPYFGAAASYGGNSLATETTDSSPALSALALLGFLYFLNLIQDVLQNNGRRKRSLVSSDDLPGNSSIAKEESYFTLYLDKEPGSAEAREVSGGKTEEEEGQTEEGRGARSFSFLEDFFIRLPQALGLKKPAIIDRGGRDEKPQGTIGNFIKSRVKMISSIMSFLQDPSPYRIRRDVQDEEVFEERGMGTLRTPSFNTLLPLIKEVLQDSDPKIQSFGAQLLKHTNESSMSVVDGVAKDEDEGWRVERDRRHTPSAMNAWYKKLDGRSVEPSSRADRVAAKVASMLGNGKSEDLQTALRKDTVPTLVELSEGLSGGHPHCLQRALCRLNAHSHNLSFMPRLALQLLSSNLAGVPLSTKDPDDNVEAIKAGRRGENCEETFNQCNTISTTDNT